MPLRPSASDVTETIKNAAQANGSVAQSIRAASGGIVKASRSSAISARPVSAIGAVVKSSAIARSIGLAPAISSGGGPPPVGSVSAHTGARTLMTLSNVNYDLYTFLTPGNNTFVVDSGSITADIFVLGGGGSGSFQGGGAGGLGIYSNVTIPPATYTVSVGSGGVSPATPYIQGINGNNSTITISGKLYRGIGGGGGGGLELAGGDGGCGGGGMRVSGRQGRALQVASDGGFNGYDGAWYIYGGGGGGMGGTGVELNGGPGLTNNFTGVAVVYGGGGGSANGSGTSPGGSGGGGLGVGGGTGGAGSNGLGGGGGGTYDGNSRGGNGGSGRVMIRVRR